MISIFWFYRLGEADFTTQLIRTHTGPYGIGVKVFWTKVHDNHTVVYYPISKCEWERACEKPEKYFLPWNIFGKKGQLQKSLNMQWFGNARRDNP